MKTLFLFISILTALAANTQTLDRRYSDDIYFGASKETLIEAVIKKAKDHYMNDVDDIIKKMKKEKKIKLSKLEDRIEFLTKMETDIRTKLMAADHWDELLSINQEYLISIPALLGNDVKIPGFGKPNTGSNGKASVTIGFTQNSLSSLSTNMVTIKEYNIQNGAPYTDAFLAELSRVMKENFGGFTHERRQWSWNMCSADKPEPVYYEKFNIKGQGITGYIEAEFGAYVYYYDKKGNNCQYRGNQLTSVSMYLYNSK